MNIKVSDLRRFQKLTSHIKGSSILPSSNCIAFGDGVIKKNALGSFVSLDCEDANENVLLDEHVLWSLTNATVSEFINIATKGNKTIFSDGRDKIPVPSIPTKEFNELPAQSEDSKPISKEFLFAIGKASEACLPIAVPATLYMYLHVGYNSVCAGNGFMGVHFPIEEDYTMVIEKKVADIVSKQPITQFAESKGHYFFFGDGLLMGFSKQEIGYADMKKIIVGNGEKRFTIDASDILSFNGFAMSLSNGGGIVTLSTGQFEMYDWERDISDTRPAENITLAEPFSYRPDNMNKAVSALDVEVLDFYEGKGLYYIKSPDTQASAIIAKIYKQ